MSISSPMKRRNALALDRGARDHLPFQPNPRLGQHFLTSSTVLRSIVNAADLSRDDVVLEIGPGFGALTRELAKRARRVVAIEKDNRLFERLDNQFRNEKTSNVTLISGDILRISFAQLDLGARYKVVANIPYYLTSRLIRRLLENTPPPYEILMMVQKEVAERIVAKPPKMNLLALSVQAYGEARIIANVPPDAFQPSPKVNSAIVKISNISRRFFKESGVNPVAFFALIRAGFATRRKTLANALVSLFRSKQKAETLIMRAHIPLRARAEALSLKQWASLAKLFEGKPH